MTWRVNARSSKESDGSLLPPPEVFGKDTQVISARDGFMDV